MELTDRDKAFINDLINIAWQAGAVKAPQMGQQLEELRAKILKKPEPPKKEESRGGK
jgi:hypothetical protein